MHVFPSFIVFYAEHIFSRKTRPKYIGYSSIMPRTESCTLFSLRCPLSIIRARNAYWAGSGASLARCRTYFYFGIRIDLCCCKASLPLAIKSLGMQHKEISTCIRAENVHFENSMHVCGLAHAFGIFWNRNECAHVALKIGRTIKRHAQVRAILFHLLPLPLHRLRRIWALCRQSACVPSP